MNQPDHQPSSFVFQPFEEPPQRGRQGGCLIAIAGLGGLFLILLVCVLCFLWFATSDSLNRREKANPTQADMNEEAGKDIDLGRIVASRPIVASEHPQYDRIVEFVDNIQLVLDDTANPKLKEFVDYDLVLDELVQRSDSPIRIRTNRSLFRDSLEKVVIGPTSFTSYEILSIENEGPDRLRVYLSYAGGYEESEPHVWWLSDKGRLRIYDWSQLELGLRISAENAAIFDASDLERIGYKNYSKLCYDYLDTAEKDVSYFERKRLVKEILIECERFRGPPELRPSVYLITARRWYHEGENERAMSLLKQIPDPSFVPGVYRLMGDIQLVQNQFRDAIKSYRKFIELLGPTPHAQSRLAACFREIGDAESERDALLVLTRSINESRFNDLAQLVELNDEFGNLQLFSQIDELPFRDDVYLYLVRYFVESDYFADRLESIHKHLQETSPNSGAAILASIKSKPGIGNLVAGLKWIDEAGEEDSEDLRYSFWYEVDEAHMVELLASSSHMDKNFETICDAYDYDGIVSDDILLSLCQTVLDSDPDNFRAHYYTGMIQSQQQKYNLAIDRLRKALEIIPVSLDDESYVRSELLSAIYRSGDESASLDFATDSELSTQLLALKAQANDFENFDKILERLDTDSDDLLYYKALMDHHHGKSDLALGALAELVNRLTEKDEYDYRIYQYRTKLVDICEQQGFPANAFTLVPADDILTLVFDRLIQKFDWPNCERLLEMETLADNKLQQVRLRQQVDWGQGNYQKVVDQSNSLLEMAKTENLSVELDRLVRSALRIGKLDLAMEFAKSAAETADRDDLVVLVALRQNDSQLAARHFQKLDEYETMQFYSDLDLMNTSWQDTIPSDQLPLRKPSYLSGGNLQFELQLLFRESQEYRLEQLQSMFAEALGDDVRVEQVILPEMSGATWVIQSRQSRIFVSQDSLIGAKAAESCDNEILKEAIRTSSFQLRVIGQAIAPTTAQTDDEISVAVVKCLASENLCALGHYSQWLTADEVARYFDQAVEQQKSPSSRLFGNGMFAGVLHYLSPHDNSRQDSRNLEFLKELVLALKRFDDSTAPDKRFVVQFGIQDGNPEQLSASVEGLRRTGYGSVTLDATMLHDARFDGSIRKDDKVGLSLYQVDGFELQVSGQTSRQNRNADR